MSLPKISALQIKQSRAKGLTLRQLRGAHAQLCCGAYGRKPPLRMACGLSWNIGVFRNVSRRARQDSTPGLAGAWSKSAQKRESSRKTCSDRS